MENPRHGPSALCKTLAHALKRLFRSVKTQDLEDSLSAPIEVIRKDVNRLSYLPRISTVSLFPDFEHSDIDYDNVEHQVSALPPTLHRSKITPDAQSVPLPAKSLSHFNLRQVYSDQSVLPLVTNSNKGSVKAHKLLEDVATGTIVSHKPVVVPKRTCSGTRSLQPTISSGSLAGSSVSNSSPSMIRRSKRSGDLRKSADAQSFATDTTLTSVPEHSLSSAADINQKDSFQMVRHFASFCVIDILAHGCPVNAVSEDLRYVYDIRERFVLNAQECSELSMDVSIGRDPDGNEVTYVLLFSPLMSPITSESCFVLVSAIDVSGYVRYAASLDQRSEAKGPSISPTSFRGRTKSGRHLISRRRIYPGHDQLEDDLPQGGFTQDDAEGRLTSTYELSQTSYTRQSKTDSEDIWTVIAREEGIICKPSASSKAPIKGASDQVSVRTPKQPMSSTSSKSSVDYADEEVLETFIESLQMLYSQYFLLSCMPFYEICYISPAVYASGDYEMGHLSYTTLNLMNNLGSHLAAGRRFQTTIRWGNKNVKKKLYCVPLIGPEPAPWICILVDKETPVHW